MATTSSSFNNFTVAAFESRRADDMQRLIERHGGTALVSPSMQEAPLEKNHTAIDFANRLLTGQIDVVVFLTGVGARALLECVERNVDRQRFLTSLLDIKCVVRGPKPLAVLKEWGISPTIRAAPPNTWREVLAALDAELPVANLTVAIQEYGAPSVSLTAGLEARGAVVESVPVYRWELPDDTGPLEKNITRIAAGEVDIALFTSAQQLVHALQLASTLGNEAEFRRGLRHAVVASIGPTTSETLRGESLPVDFEPKHAKMANFVNELAAEAATLVANKRSATARAKQIATNDTAAAWEQSPFMLACRRQPVPYTPVWLMRQAGRYMPEYRAVREKVGFLQLCRNPQLCSEVMCTAVEQLGVDAAIIFSDLLPILEPMGLRLEFTAGDGPKIHNPVRAAEDVGRVTELEDVSPLSFVYDTVAQTRRDLPGDIPLIGFAGAPFTLASYAIEGGGSRNYLHTKSLMYRHGAAWHDLLGRLARSIARYVNAQISAGAQAIQIFDSWVGCLAPGDYRQFVLPHVKAMCADITAGVPVIHFGTGNPALLPLLAEAGGDVIGVDWRVDIADAWLAVGEDRAIQGNLDPALLLADREAIDAGAQNVLDAVANRPGHIFNLGHGVLPQTPVANARALIDFVHQASRR